MSTSRDFRCQIDESAGMEEELAERLRRAKTAERLRDPSSWPAQAEHARAMRAATIRGSFPSAQSWSTELVRRLELGRRLDMTRRALEPFLRRFRRKVA